MENAVKEFIAENKHQFGYIMQEASEQWKKIDPNGALTVGACNFFIERYGGYHENLDKVDRLEKGIKAIIEYIEFNSGTVDKPKRLTQEQIIDVYGELKNLLK